jgi:hypothetical protein
MSAWQLSNSPPKDFKTPFASFENAADPLYVEKVYSLNATPYATNAPFFLPDAGYEVGHFGPDDYKPHISIPVFPTMDEITRTITDVIQAETEKQKRFYLINEEKGLRETSEPVTKAITDAVEKTAEIVAKKVAEDIERNNMPTVQEIVSLAKNLGGKVTLAWPLVKLALTSVGVNVDAVSPILDSAATVISSGSALLESVVPTVPAATPSPAIPNVVPTPAVVPTSAVPTPKVTTKRWRRPTDQTTINDGVTWLKNSKT